MGGCENNFNMLSIPPEFSGDRLIELLNPTPKKKEPKANILKKEGKEGTAKISGGVAIVRPKTGVFTPRGISGSEVRGIIQTDPAKITKGEEE